ncbi:hypothetical protein K461DRAFT_2858 [Myriangium duriaei CBS 260.36]|uniref:FAD dependent oxidoreductase domain-containing protein n=1 Tax=Myriangium duriaei CBS 260.36 TaxID=1168546 RepID=A0A9P4J8G6_9PEZI|nr:hypothetical protein K461DRAFT_2858 [Myriangium duriaei CBS 260.36]
MAHVAILGAGVIGLQCAIDLLNAGYKVTIVAAHFPGDSSPEYTSPWAGGHWRTHASAGDTEQQAWDLETYEHWIKEIESAKTLQDRKALGLKVSDPSLLSLRASTNATR